MMRKVDDNMIRKHLKRVFWPARQKENLESGQAIVFVALLIIAMAAFVGLAIDGGGLLFLQRDLQNATDAAVVAATYARCTNGNPVTAAYAAAAQNGFDNNGTTNWVNVYFPPLDGPGMGDNRYVQVNIRAIKPPFFIQLVYGGPLEVTSRAVAYCTPSFNPGSVPALFGISQTCNQTVDFSGSTTYIDGGIFSNHDIHAQGGNASDPADVYGLAETVLDSIRGPSADIVNFHDGVATNVAVREDPLAATFPIEYFAPGGRFALEADPYLAIMTAADDPDARLQGGKLQWSPDGRELRGVYYVNGDVNISGRDVTFHPDGITIVATGKISISDSINVRHHEDGKGFLFYSNYDATNCGGNAVRISNATLFWQGALYAPRGGVQVSGSVININPGTIVAETINLSGSDLTIIYDPEIFPPYPPSVQVVE